MHHAFEELLGFHCGPALAGIKPANLVSVSREEYPDLHTLTEEYGRMLHEAGLRFKLICGCGKRFLLLVYREARLRAQLEEPEISAILSEAGYPDRFEDRLAHLEVRLTSGEFPHEIGAFLGYPARDIRGFQQDKGKGCLYSGLWKVYDDVEGAIARFARYERCRDCICRHLKQGKTLTQMFRVA
ncbi:MAG: DUF3793 family protein [Oscillospiraceae bacterium]|nr:DUF3793 family protein [Oscillospiraceae bacterium]